MTGERVTEVLSQIEPFTQLNPETLDYLGTVCLARVYPQGSYVFRQGEPSQGFLFIIMKGQAEITGTNDFGREMVVGYRNQKQFFGETVVLTGKRYPASVKAGTDLDCLLLNKEDFEGLLDHNPVFAGYFTAILSDRFRDLFTEVVAQQSYEAYEVDAQPFHRRAGELMHSPVISCSISTPIAEIGRLMSEQGVSSVVVTDNTGYALGIVTEKDLVETVFTSDEWAGIRNMECKTVMNPKVVTVSQDAFFYQVLLEMVRNQSKHVVVLNQGKAVGVITMRDLVQSRNTGVLSIVGQLEYQRDLPGLVKASKEIDQVLKALVAEKAPIPEVCQVITELYDRLTRKVISLCELQLEEDGWGPPPVEYCWLNMGSGGRGEQTLRTDQDNAIIYARPERPESEQRVKQYFLHLAARVVDALVECGFSRCRGEVVAANPRWCHSLSDWKESLIEWIKHPEPNNIRLLTIFLDFRPVYGQAMLASKLREHVLHLVSSFPVILRHLAEDDSRTKVPIGLWGRIQTERLAERRHQLDLKRAVCVHIVDCLRIYAYKNRILEPNTLDRLGRLAEIGVFDAEEVRFLRTAYESLMLFRIRENLRKVSSGENADNYIELAKLNRSEREILRNSLKAAARLQNLTSNAFLLF